MEEISLLLFGRKDLSPMIHLQAIFCPDYEAASFFSGKSFLYFIFRFTFVVTFVILHFVYRIFFLIV